VERIEAAHGAVEAGDEQGPERLRQAGQALGFGARDEDPVADPDRLGRERESTEVGADGGAQPFRDPDQPVPEDAHGA